MIRTLWVMKITSSKTRGKKKTSPPNSNTSPNITSSKPLIKKRGHEDMLLGLMPIEPMSGNPTPNITTIDIKIG